MNKVVIYKENAKHDGDNNIYQTPLSSLEKAIKEINDKWGSDEKEVDIIDELSGYITDHPKRKIIGLEKKLEKGDKTEIIEDAVLLKNKFAKHMAKNQMSMREQQVYIQVLSTINTLWRNKIRPLIASGANKVTVDKAIIEEIIEPVHNAIVIYNCTIDTELVSGMLYFLTGKCHLIWEQKC